MRNPLPRVLYQENSRPSGLRRRHRSQNPSRLDLIEKMGADIDRAGLVDIGAAGVEIADRHRLGAQRFGCQRRDQRLPVGHLLDEVRHVDAVDAKPRRNATRSMRHGSGRLSLTGPPSSNGSRAAIKTPLLARRRHRRARMRDSRARPAPTAAAPRIAAAVFRDDEDVGVVPRQRLRDRRQPRAAALPDVPREEPQGRYSPGTLLAIRRPLTSAPASGDIRRKNGTDSMREARHHRQREREIGRAGLRRVVRRQHQVEQQRAGADPDALRQLLRHAGEAGGAAQHARRHVGIGQAC